MLLFLGGTKIYQWDNRKYVAGTRMFPHAKEFLRKLSAVWARALKISSSPILGRKSLKHVGLKGHQIICQPAAPTCLPPPIDTRGEFRPRQTRQLPRAVDLKGRLLSCQSY